MLSWRMITEERNVGPEEPCKGLRWVRGLRWGIAEACLHETAQPIRSLLHHHRGLHVGPDPLACKAPSLNRKQQALSPASKTWAPTRLGPGIMLSTSRAHNRAPPMGPLAAASPEPPLERAFRVMMAFSVLRSPWGTRSMSRPRLRRGVPLPLPHRGP